MSGPSLELPASARSFAGARVAAAADRWLQPPLVAGVTLWLLAIDHGGTGPGAWAWAAVLLAVAGVRLVRQPVALSVAERRWLWALAGLVGWAALSTAWSSDASASLHEAERTLVYLALGLAMLVAPPAAARRVPHAMLLAITAVCAYGLATRMLPSLIHAGPRIGHGRLYEPLGYWNALGLLAAIGTLIALQLVASPDRSERLRMAGGAALVVVVPALYLTFSRGALLALLVGAGVSMVGARRPFAWLVTSALHLVPPGLVILIASTQPALTGAKHADRARGGRVLMLALVVALPLALVIVRKLGRRPPWLDAIEVSWRAVGAAFGASVALILALAAFHYGSPARAADAFGGSLTSSTWFRRDLHHNLNNRYGEMSLSGRVNVWRGALDLAADHPLVGAGAGSFGRFWAARDTPPLHVVEAHSLYLETPAELGVVGVILLLALLIPPLRGLRRPSPAAALVAGAYAAFLVHAAFDWDWEIPAVTVAGLLCATVLLRTDEARRRRLSPGGQRRLAMACAGLAGVAVVAALVNVRPLGM